MDIIKEIEQTLFTWKDEPYGQFQRKLLPTVPGERVIGVRTPELRKYAKELGKRPDVQQFLEHLPHAYFEEDQLHAFIISGIRDMDECVEQLEKFLPYVDNWATCDQMSPKVFQKNRKQLFPHINAWIASEHPYTVRYGVGMLMQHFLDEDFKPEYPKLVTAIHSEEYYINMEIAWYMATALAKQWESTISYIENKKMGVWVHNKTIQKAVESYRITEEQKCYLKTFRIRGTR